MSTSRRRTAGGFLALVLAAASGLFAAPARAAGPNLSPGKAVSASASLGGFGANLVNDQNPSSYWESPSNAFPQWVQIDLGAATSVDQVT
ncbi:discoidin domain-containing protein, partial [Actinoplanes sp. NPDC051633]|uniref:discoidin domain-containing protein n=1 Tax=Actinoplanes sp. NPDC051633 TaxID=3155670 RepID=UPI003416AE71